MRLAKPRVAVQMLIAPPADCSALLTPPLATPVNAAGVLPEEFFSADAESGVRGGVETGFMSTSTRREVALSYAGGGGGHAATVLEIRA